MKTDNMKKNMKFYIVGFSAVLLLVASVIIFIYLNKPDSKASEIAQEVNDENIEVADKVTPALVEDKPVYVKSVEEIIAVTSRKVVSKSVPEAEEIVLPVEEDIVEEENQDEVEVVPEYENIISEPKKDDTKIKDAPAPKKDKEKKEEKIVVIDESPVTIKEKNVNEYKGGEKTGKGNDFMNQMPKTMPAAPDWYVEVDASTGTDGVQVGTWN